MIELRNSAFVRAPAGLIRRGAGMRGIDVPVRYGLLRRPGGQLCLVDTGYGPAVTSGRRSAALQIYNALLRPRILQEGSPAAMLASFSAVIEDVDTIVLTHFHADHVARLNEFPKARILAHGGAAKAVLTMSNRQAIHHGVFKELLPDDLEGRIQPIEALPMLPAHPELGCGHDLFGDGSCLAIDLPGHAKGHFGIFWQHTGPCLYAVDATWNMRALLEDRTPALSRAVVFDDRRGARVSEERLRKFIHAGGTVKLCHDLEAA
nr:MBL fold metallo-hydrolase [Mesorhizobium sp.]